MLGLNLPKEAVQVKHLWAWLLCTVSHSPVDRHAHGNVGGQTADDIGYGFCHKHAQYTEAPSWQQQCQRYDNDGLAQQGEENGMLRIAHRLKCGLPREL